MTNKTEPSIVLRNLKAEQDYTKKVPRDFYIFLKSMNHASMVVGIQCYLIKNIIFCVIALTY